MWCRDGDLIGCVYGMWCCDGDVIGCAYGMWWCDGERGVGIEGGCHDLRDFLCYNCLWAISMETEITAI